MCFLLYTLIINLVSMLLYGVDKWKSVHNKWRIPEKTLLLTAFLGGATGALLGMYLFHHKTKKAKFAVTVPILFFLELILFSWLLWKLGTMLL